MAVPPSTPTLGADDMNVGVGSVVPLGKVGGKWRSFQKLKSVGRGGGKGGPSPKPPSFTFHLARPRSALRKHVANAHRDLTDIRSQLPEWKTDRKSSDDTVESEESGGDAVGAPALSSPYPVGRSEATAVPSVDGGEPRSRKNRSYRCCTTSAPHDDDDEPGDGVQVIMLEGTFSQDGLNDGDLVQSPPAAAGARVSGDSGGLDLDGSNCPVRTRGFMGRKGSKPKEGGEGAKKNEGGESNSGGGVDSNGGSGRGGGGGAGEGAGSGGKAPIPPPQENGAPSSAGGPPFGPDRHSFATACALASHTGSEASAPAGVPTWTPAPGTDFKVRIGPNYKKTGAKEPSSESLYEVYAVRYFRSKRRTKNGVGNVMPMPEVPPPRKGNEASADDNDHEDLRKEALRRHPHAPDVMLVHFMLPYEPPTMFKAKDDGPGGECIYYLRPSRRLLEELAGTRPSTPATDLFVKWCATCRTDPKMRGRFKCMALVRDIDTHNFGLLKTYNGKPVLITESGRVQGGVHGDVRYLEISANVHQWAFIAKKGFVSIIPKFQKMQMEIGFTIESHTDGEMPECMLGSTVLSYISEATGPMITPAMQEPVHTHQP